MKAKILHTIFLLLLPLCVVLFGAGCEKDEDNYENIPLEYTKCPCDSEMSFIKSATMDKILLFDSTKTTFSEMQELSLVEGSSQYISFNPESNNAIFYLQKGMYSSIGYFCNFPEAASEWEIPSDGIYVSYSVDVFETCRSFGSIGGWTSFSDNILTILKRKTK